MSTNRWGVTVNVAKFLIPPNVVCLIGPHILECTATSVSFVTNFRLCRGLVFFPYIHTSKFCWIGLSTVFIPYFPFSILWLKTFSPVYVLTFYTTVKCLKRHFHHFFGTYIKDQSTIVLLMRGFIYAIYSPSVLNLLRLSRRLFQWSLSRNVCVDWDIDFVTAFSSNPEEDKILSCSLGIRYVALNNTFFPEIYISTCPRYSAVIFEPSAKCSVVGAICSTFWNSLWALTHVRVSHYRW